MQQQSETNILQFSLNFLPLCACSLQYCLQYQWQGQASHMNSLFYCRSAFCFMAQTIIQRSLHRTSYAYSLSCLVVEILPILRIKLEGWHYRFRREETCNSSHCTHSATIEQCKPLQWFMNTPNVFSCNGQLSQCLHLPVWFTCSLSSHPVGFHTISPSRSGTKPLLFHMFILSSLACA